MKSRANLGAITLGVVFFGLVLLFSYMPVLEQSDATSTCALGAVLPLVVIVAKAVMR